MILFHRILVQWFQMWWHGNFTNLINNLIQIYFYVYFILNRRSVANVTTISVTWICLKISCECMWVLRSVNPYLSFDCGMVTVSFSCDMMRRGESVLNLHEGKGTLYLNQSLNSFCLLAQIENGNILKDERHFSMFFSK